MAINPSVVFQFTHGRFGWSERYWYTSNAPLSTVRFAGQELLDKRKMMLALGVLIPYAYASYDDEFRDVFGLALPEPGPNGVWNGALPPDVEQPNVSFVVRCHSGVRAGKYIYLAGVPDGSVNYPPGQPPILDVGFRNAFINFVQVLTNGQWGWKGITYDSVISPIQNVTAMVADGTSWIVTVPSTADFRAGRKAKLTNGVFTGRLHSRPNRVYLVTEVTNATTLRLDWGGADLFDLEYTGLGKLQVQNTVIWPITVADVDKIGTRKRGVGGDPPRGRQRRARSR